jgi:type I restriction enzyme R subunit
LQNNGYEYLQIKNSDELIANLRKQLDKLNDYKFTENEWKQILTNYLANQNEGVKEKPAKFKRTLFMT